MKCFDPTGDNDPVTPEYSRNRTSADGDLPDALPDIGQDGRKEKFSQHELQAELLDRLLNAVQSRDDQERDQLLQNHPELREWHACFNAVDRLIPDDAVVGDHTLPWPGRLPSLPESHASTNSSLPGIALFRSEALSEDFANGRYVLLGEVNRGGMGIVYKARQRDLDRIVAIKMILSSDSASADEVRRFRAEARAVARLTHRNIIQVHDSGEHLGRHFFVMDFIDGESLSDLIRRGPLEETTAASWMVMVAQAVDYLHGRGILHRDLKPSNVLIDAENQPIVTDFGLAKIFDTDSHSTRSGVILGTPSYMSPEQAAGKRDQISVQSDVYSLGAVLYEMLTGQPPFREATPFDTMIQVLEGEPVRPRTIRRSVSRELELICLKCLEKLPQHRYSSAKELALDLNRFLQREPVAANPGGLIHRMVRWSRRQPALAMHLLTLLAAGIVMHVHYLLTIDTLPNQHWTQIGVLGAWTVLSVGLQWLLENPRWENFSRRGTIVTDTIMLTTCLALSADNEGTLLIFFPLLIVVAGLSFRPSLVWLTTILTSCACVSLFIIKAGLRDPWHFPLLILMTLYATGAATAFQINRVRILQGPRKEGTHHGGSEQ